MYYIVKCFIVHCLQVAVDIVVIHQVQTRPLIGTSSTKRVSIIKLGRTNLQSQNGYFI